MSLRFWQRVRLAPGVTLNLSKSTASLSFGPQGAKYTISPRGNRATVGLPGSGLFYTIHDRKGQRARPATTDKLSLGFFRRLVTPLEEQNLVDGMRLLSQGDQGSALAALEKAKDIPDAAWMAGMMRLRQEDFATAKTHLEHALARLDDLGTLFEKYDIAPQADLPIADGVFAHIRPRERGTRLALVELAEATGDLGAAMAQLDRLLDIDAGDPVVILSFCQIAMDHPDNQSLAERVIELSANITNETPIHTGILLYRARALAACGLPDAAISVLTLAGRRRKDRPERLLHQVRFDRAELYDQVGRKAQARREFEKLYAEFPGFPGLSERLGLR